MRLVAILNQKGGVGKTTTTVNLGAALAAEGKNVLLVDLDPQGNLTDHLGVEVPEDAGTIYDVLTNAVPLAKVALPTGTKRLEILPGDEDLAAVEVEIADRKGRETLLRRAFEDVPAGWWDWVLVDCPPSLGLLTLNAMAACPEVLITLQTEYFALRGLGQLTRIVGMVQESIHPALHISAIIPTLVNPVTNLAKEVIEEVREHFGDLVLETRIRQNVRLAEAPGHGQHIFQYAPQSPGATDYRALARELLARAAAGATKQAASKAQEAAPTPVAPGGPPAATGDRVPEDGTANA